MDVNYIYMKSIPNNLCEINVRCSLYILDSCLCNLYERSTFDIRKVISFMMMQLWAERIRAINWSDRVNWFNMMYDICIVVILCREMMRHAKLFRMKLWLNHSRNGFRHIITSIRCILQFFRHQSIQHVRNSTEMEKECVYPTHYWTARQCHLFSILFRNLWWKCAFDNFIHPHLHRGFVATCNYWANLGISWKIKTFVLLLRFHSKIYEKSNGTQCWL